MIDTGSRWVRDLSSVELVRLELNCRKAASNAEDPEFKQLWLKKADQIRAMYDKTKELP